MSNETIIAFSKMNGLGNSFVVIDARARALDLTPVQVRAMADPAHKATKGCDQVLVIHPSREANEQAVFMQIFNADGGEVEACGNGARAVVALLVRNGGDEIIIETLGGTLHGRATTGSSFSIANIKMPLPKFGWQDIPLSQEYTDTQEIQLHPDLPPAFMVNVGNPHAVMFVAEDEDVDGMAKEYGEILEHLSVFPKRANITFVRINENDEIHIATWERGAGLTLACGTAACAVGIAAYMREQHKAPYQGQFIIYPPFGRKKESGGVRAAALQRLLIGFGTESELSLAGPVQFEFDGELTL